MSDRITVLTNLGKRAEALRKDVSERFDNVFETLGDAFHGERKAEIARVRRERAHQQASTVRERPNAGTRNQSQWGGEVQGRFVVSHPNPAKQDVLLDLISSGLPPTDDRNPENSICGSPSSGFVGAGVKGKALQGEAAFQSDIRDCIANTTKARREVDLFQRRFDTLFEFILQPVVRAADDTMIPAVKLSKIRNAQLTMLDLRNIYGGFDSWLRSRGLDLSFRADADLFRSWLYHFYDMKRVGAPEPPYRRKPDPLDDLAGIDPNWHNAGPFSKSDTLTASTASGRIAQGVALVRDIFGGAPGGIDIEPDGPAYWIDDPVARASHPDDGDIHDHIRQMHEGLGPLRWVSPAYAATEAGMLIGKGIKRIKGQ